jgi:hypothetical protein
MELLRHLNNSMINEKNMMFWPLLAFDIGRNMRSFISNYYYINYPRNLWPSDALHF